MGFVTKKTFKNAKENRYQQLDLKDMFLGKLWMGVSVVRIGNRNSGLEKGSNTGQPRMKHFVYVVSEVPWHVKNMIQGNWSLESNLKDYFDMSILSDLCQCHVSTELR